VVVEEGEELTEEVILQVGMVQSLGNGVTSHVDGLTDTLTEVGEGTGEGGELPIYIYIIRREGEEGEEGEVKTSIAIT